MPEILPTRVFTREEPCTKVHIWNCFHGPDGFRDVPVVESRSQIGLNTPKYLRREYMITVATKRGVEYYSLTNIGKTWLTNGLKRYLELHPEHAVDVLYKAVTAAPRRTRTVGGASIRRDAATRHKAE